MATSEQLKSDTDPAETMSPDVNRLVAFVAFYLLNECYTAFICCCMFCVLFTTIVHTFIVLRFRWDY